VQPSRHAPKSFQYETDPATGNVTRRNVGVGSASAADRAPETVPGDAPAAVVAAITASTATSAETAMRGSAPRDPRRRTACTVERIVHPAERLDPAVRAPRVGGRLRPGTVVLPIGNFGWRRHRRCHEETFDA
jgi:hypothetical protein